jgi:hypothetical protein
MYAWESVHPFFLPYAELVWLLSSNFYGAQSDVFCVAKPLLYALSLCLRRLMMKISRAASSRIAAIAIQTPAGMPPFGSTSVGSSAGLGVAGSAVFFALSVPELSDSTVAESSEMRPPGLSVAVVAPLPAELTVFAGVVRFELLPEAVAVFPVPFDAVPDGVFGVFEPGV